MNYRAIVIGASAGGLQAIKTIVTSLTATFGIPIIVAQHLSPLTDRSWIGLINNKSALTVKEADEKERISPGTIYIAPANYHLLIEREETFSLSIDPKVNYARPSIDVLFESAADVYGSHLIGVVLTGANNDGAGGLRQIKDKGGLAIVQQPETAESSCMPLAAIAATQVDYILPLEEIVSLFVKLDR